MSTKPPVVAIIGPTATGKSHLAIQLAKTYNGEIVSADSRQIYKEISIGTAKISKQEMDGVPHYMINVASLAEYFSVTQYQKLAKQHIHDIHARSRPPFVVGGTGLYIQSIVDNVLYPEVPPNEPLRKKLESYSTEQLRQELKEKDPFRAQTIDQNNNRRLIRALEIYEHQQKPLQELKKRPLYNTLQIGIYPPDNLHEKIQTRFYEWIQQGMIEEVQALRERYQFSWERIQAIGLQYRCIADYLQGNISRSQMEQNSIQSIAQYAKRQMSWFKKDNRIQWINTREQADAIVAQFIKKHYNTSK